MSTYEQDMNFSAREIPKHQQLNEQHSPIDFNEYIASSDKTQKLGGNDYICSIDNRSACIDRIDVPVNSYDRKAAGNILDASLDSGRRPNGTVLEQVGAEFIGGNASDFAETIKGMHPAQLESLASKLNEGLKESGSETRFDVTGDGNLVVSNPDTNKGVEINAKTGALKVVGATSLYDGTVLYNGEYLNVDAAGAFKDLSNITVNGILGKGGRLPRPPIEENWPGMNQPQVQDNDGGRRRHGPLPNVTRRHWLPN